MNLATAVAMPVAMRVAQRVTRAPILGGSSVAAAVPIVTSTPAADRNDFTGVVGFEFTPARDLAIRYLGRTIGSTFLANHAVKVWRVSDQTEITSATITPGSAIDGNGFAYEECTAVTLANGTTYRIASDETASGDNFVNVGSGNMAGRFSSADMAVSTAVFGSTQSVYPNMNTQGVNSGFGLLNLYT